MTPSSLSSHRCRFDPDCGDKDPILPALLDNLPVFVSELQSAIVSEANTLAANIINGLANLIAYVGTLTLSPTTNAQVARYAGPISTEQV